VDLKSMKMEHKEMDREEKACASLYGEGRPEYPWGLLLRCDEEILKKLGITSLPDVGSSLDLVAKVKVCSVSSNETEKGAMRHIELQITDMALGGGETTA
jgi:hypothetical protein